MDNLDKQLVRLKNEYNDMAINSNDEEIIRKIKRVEKKRSINWVPIKYVSSVVGALLIAAVLTISIVKIPKESLHHIDSSPTKLRSSDKKSNGVQNIEIDKEKYQVMIENLQKKINNSNHYLQQNRILHSYVIENSNFILTEIEQEISTNQNQSTSREELESVINQDLDKVNFLFSNALLFQRADNNLIRTNFSDLAESQSERINQQQLNNKINDLYIEIARTKDLSVLKDLPPFEVAFLYFNAVTKDNPEIQYLLHVEDNQFITRDQFLADYKKDIKDHSMIDFILKNYNSFEQVIENSSSSENEKRDLAIISFECGGNESSIHFKMIQDDEGWKVAWTPFTTSIH